MKKKGRTQLERLLEALQNNPQGLTSIQIVNMFILNYKGRIFDLRRGKLHNTPYNIECTRVKGGTWKYTLHWTIFRKGEGDENKYIQEPSGQMVFSMR